MAKPLEFRFTLSNPIEGSIQIDEPVGWNDSKFTLKRDADYHSPLFEYSSQLKFYRANSRYNGGAEFILFILDKYGPDGEVGILVEISDHGSTYETVFTGRLNLEDLTETEKYVECILEQEDFVTIFNQRSELQVSFKDNISVDGVSLQPYEPYSLNLHSKVLVKRAEVETKQAIFIPPQLTHGFTVNAGLPGFPDINQTGIGDQPDTEFNERTSYVIFDLSGTTVEELEHFWKDQGAAIPEPPSDIFTAKEGGLYSFNLDFDFIIIIDAVQLSFESTWLNCGPKPEEQSPTNVTGMIESAILQYHFIIKDKDDLIKYEHATSPTSDYINNCNTSYKELPYSANVNISDYPLEAGDKVFFYVSVYMSGTYVRKLINSEVGYLVGYTLKEGSYLKVLGKTFTEASTAPALRVHDVFQNICNKLTNRDNSFHSDFFGYPGAPYHSYQEKGCGADFAILNGFNIRNFPWEDRPLQISFKELFESLDAIFGLGLAIETIDGVQKIRIEPLSYFYTKEVVLNLDHVSGIKRTIAKEKYYNEVRVGYNDSLPEEINGLDEINTNHVYSTSNITIGSPLILQSNVIASGSLIEVTRRNQYNATLTTDTKFDDRLFIIALNRSDSTIAEKNENFDTVNNLLSPETSYNLRLWPAYNLLRHGNQINGSLLTKAGSSYNFQSGEGNYKVEMEMKESETDCPGSFDGELLVGGQNIPWAYANLPEVDPLWVPFYFDFKYPLSFKELQLLKKNKNKAIFITGDLFEEGLGVTAFVMEVESEPAKGLATWKCLAASTQPFNYIPEDANHLLLQSGFDFLFENGDLMLIN